MAILYIEPVNYSVPLHGNGIAAIARSAVNVMGNRFLYVGLTDYKSEIGQLVTKIINLKPIQVYAVGLAAPPGKIRVMPENFRFALQVYWHMRSLKKLSSGSIITRTYTVLWLLSFIRNQWKIVFYYPGLGNPMLIGRRPRIGKFLASMYEKIQHRCLERSYAVYAAASVEATDSVNRKIVEAGRTTKIIPIPTAVDTDLFRPQARNLAKRTLGLDGYQIVLVFVGRLAHVKGLPLLFEVVDNIKSRKISCCLVLVGDGEERNNLLKLKKSMKLENNILFMGKQPPDKIVNILGAADVFVMASYTEGFSNAMVEAIACGKALVTTQVSGADEIISEGLNGFIVRQRDPKLFADFVIQATTLRLAEKVSRDIALEKYAERGLWARLCKGICE